MTEVSTLVDVNRAVRKKKDLEYLRYVSNEAKTIKLADLIDNSCSIIKYDPELSLEIQHTKGVLIANCIFSEYYTTVIREGNLK